ncbi:hypothetical protein [Nocardioides donggukensis]|uniref:Uncharacterized protein n=1 Tax=Nocardioides donggukensis TaxID=2774019 RepID=A0A927K8K8_9ACTN|nr:hypothetical protein [Nocardioides donggukensis]MBD8871190.1 hypothetical protein [Nocardioides donggukensis]
MPDELTDLLGPDVPASVLALAPERRDRLASLVRAARAREDAEMAEATGAALKGVPLPLRGAVRKALGA